MEIVARHQYSDRGVFASDLSFVGKVSRVKRADAKDCDLNLIFKRFEKTGRLPDMIVREPRYGDFSDAPTFQESFEIVRKAEEQFRNLDAPIRNRFENDPVKFLEFVNDPKNIDEMAKMGLLKPEVVQARKAALKAKSDEAAAAEKVKQDEYELALIEKVKKAIQATA